MAKPITCPQCGGSGKVKPIMEPYFLHTLQGAPIKSPLEVAYYINDLYRETDFKAEVITLFCQEGIWYILFKNLEYFR